MGSVNLSSMVDAIVAFPWLRMGIIFVFLYVVLFFYGLFFADGLIFPAPSSPNYEKDGSVHFVDTPSGLKIAYKIWQPHSPSKGVILYSHGNAEDLGTIEPTILPWVEKGFTVVGYDYPGYGHSSGKPSEQGCYDAIDAVYAKIVEELGISNQQLVSWGRSLGTGLSCYLGSKEKLAGVLLETPYLTAFLTVTEIPLVPFDRFRNIERAPKLKSESLVIHGDEDEIIPFRHGKRLFKSLPEPKTFLEIEDGGHNNLPEKGGEKYRTSILQFLNRVLDS